MDHSPYTTNPAFFGLLKKHLAGKEFAADSAKKQAVIS
jgi:hypothetical protein